MKKATVITAVIMTATILIPTFNTLYIKQIVPLKTIVTPIESYYNPTTNTFDIADSNISDIKKKLPWGACVRSFSKIIEVNQWYVEPSMEYMFSGWLIPYNKIKGEL